MNSSTTRGRLRIGAAVALALTVLAGPLAATGAGAAPKPKEPALTVDGTGTWEIREWIDDVVVRGTGSLTSGGKTTDVLLAAVVQTDDRTLPAPGECERAFATMSAYGVRGVDLTLIGIGDVCGTWVQPGVSIVTHVFTGRYEVYGKETMPKRLEGTDGWYEVRLAEDGSASASAVDT
ncbi:MAG TPA: hypothetical protein VFU14_05950 [Acidimicrobiales bacterium]|nr:hypothetical protein [Acidimicrobiales bacterium]